METEAQKLAKELAAQVQGNMAYFIFTKDNNTGNIHIECEIDTETFCKMVITAYRLHTKLARIYIVAALKNFFNNIKQI